MQQFRNELSLAINIHTYFSKIRSQGGNSKGKDIASLRNLIYIYLNFIFAACP